MLTQPDQSYRKWAYWAYQGNIYILCTLLELMLPHHGWGLHESNVAFSYLHVNFQKFSVSNF